MGLSQPERIRRHPDRPRPARRDRSSARAIPLRALTGEPRGGGLEDRAEDLVGEISLAAPILLNVGGLATYRARCEAVAGEGYEGFRWSHASIMFNVLKKIPQVRRLVREAEAGHLLPDLVGRQDLAARFVREILQGCPHDPRRLACPE